ncbi:DMT family transporter [Candidatus Gottesmanbacteria bacterium]|nr:DMT family transporter [Candidatus Gottesmanbacteria bacterium]
MSWQILTFASVLFSSLAIVLQKVLLREKKRDPILSAIIFLFLCGIFLGAYTIIRGVGPLPISGRILPNLLTMPLIYAVGQYCIFRAISQIDVSLFTILFTTRALWTVIASTIFLHEYFTLERIIGMALILFGITFVMKKDVRMKIEKGWFYALVAGAAFGFGVVNDAYLLQFYQVSTYLTFSFFATGFVLFIINIQRMRNIGKTLNEKSIGPFVLLGLLNALQAITFFEAYHVGHNVGQISILNQMQTILAVVISIIFLRETRRWGEKLFGALISMIGVILAK